MSQPPNNVHQRAHISIEADASSVFDVLAAGGLAIIPSDVGYGIVALDENALQKAFVTKQRQPHKRHAMIGSYALHREIHTLPEHQQMAVDLLVRDLNVPLGVVGPYRPEHPLIQAMGEELLAKSSMEGTLAMLVNGGPFQDELSRLCAEAGRPLMGSSANLTGRGTKSLLEDIEPEILDTADIIIDYGMRKYSYPRASSTMIDFRDTKVLRFGACYDVIKYALEHFLGVEAPVDPGKEILFSGRVSEMRVNGQKKTLDVSSHIAATL